LRKGSNQTSSGGWDLREKTIPFIMGWDWFGEDSESSQDSMEQQMRRRGNSASETIHGGRERKRKVKRWI